MGFLTNKTAIITGAGRAVLSDGRCGSIGYGIATAYAKEGANLVITGRNTQKLDAAKEELERLYGIRVLTVQADVNAGADNAAVVENVVQQAVNTFGDIHVLINNAQASASGVTLADHTTEQFDLAVYSGLYATFHYMKACYPYLKKTQGSVINFASGAGLFGNFGQCAYAAAKEGIRGLTRVAATEWGRHQCQHRLPAGMDCTAGKLQECLSGRIRKECQDATGRTSGRCRTGDRSGLRSAGFSGFQVHDRRNHYTGRRSGTASVKETVTQHHIHSGRGTRPCLYFFLNTSPMVNPCDWLSL